jgi:hypothetical protein
MIIFLNACMFEPASSGITVRGMIQGLIEGASPIGCRADAILVALCDLEHGGLVVHLGCFEEPPANSVSQ